MRMSIKFLSTALIFCCTVFVLQTTAFGQVHKVPLEDKRITIRLNQKPLYTIFYQLIQRYDIAIGFEESALDRHHRDYYFGTNVAPSEVRELEGRKEPLGPYSSQENLLTVDFKDVRLKEVLDEIVKQMRFYDWEIVDDVVNIYPIEGRDKRLEKLLNTKIERLELGAGNQVQLIQGQIMMALPEFEEFLTENGIDCDTARPYSSFDERLMLDGMAFSNVKFKQLLNSITRLKRGGWILQIKRQKTKPNKEFVEILI